MTRPRITDSVLAIGPILYLWWVNLLGSLLWQSFILNTLLMPPAFCLHGNLAFCISAMLFASTLLNQILSFQWVDWCLVSAGSITVTHPKCPPFQPPGLSELSAFPTTWKYNWFPVGWPFLEMERDFTHQRKGMSGRVVPGAPLTAVPEVLHGRESCHSNHRP